MNKSVERVLKRELARVLPLAVVAGLGASACSSASGSGEATRPTVASTMPANNVGSTSMPETSTTTTAPNKPTISTESKAAQAFNKLDLSPSDVGPGIDGGITGLFLKTLPDGTTVNIGLDATGTINHGGFVKPDPELVNGIIIKIYSPGDSINDKPAYVLTDQKNTANNSWTSSFYQYVNPGQPFGIESSMNSVETYLGPGDETPSSTTTNPALANSIHTQIANYELGVMRAVLGDQNLPRQLDIPATS